MTKTILITGINGFLGSNLSKHLKGSYFISGLLIMIKKFKDYLLANKVAIENVLTNDWE